MGFLSKIVDTVKDVAGAVTDFIPGADLFAGGVDLLGGLMSNNANASQARAQMAFQADQSGTSYQRAVKDLQAAGLNPMLAYANGGASSGSGAAAHMENALGKGVSTAMAANRLRSEISLMKSQEKKTDMDAYTSHSADLLNRELGAKARADTAASIATAKNAAVTNQLLQAALPEAKNNAAAQDSWWKRNISPYLPDFSASSSALKFMR